MFHCRLQPGELLRLLDLDGSLLKTHCHPRTSSDFPKSILWSGRRESNPRPTAWKAVTLPLSYSRETQLSAISRQLSAKPQRLKPPDFRLPAARLKPCPFQNPAPSRHPQRFTKAVSRTVQP